MPKPKKQDPPPPPNACIQCMRRPAAPHNGGLCEVCAPPLETPKLRAFIAARRAAAAQGQPAPGLVRVRDYRLGA